MSKTKASPQSAAATLPEPAATLVLITRSLNPSSGGTIVPAPMRRRIPKGDGSSYELRVAPGEILALFTEAEREAFANEIANGTVNTATLYGQQAEAAIATLVNEEVGERLFGYCDAIRALSSQLIDANIQPEFRVDREGHLIECNAPTVQA